MEPSNEVTVWLSRLGQGDNQAADAIWQVYFEKLVRYARRKLEGARGPSSDEEDVALSAMFSFCRGLEAGNFEKIEDREDLWKLLVTITARKACAHRRRAMAQKRGGGKVYGESVFRRPDGEDTTGIEQVLGTEPTAELADGVVESCREMLESLGDITLQQIALWTLEGYSTQEIGERLGCVRRTVERKLQRIRARWTQLGYASETEDQDRHRP